MDRPRLMPADTPDFMADAWASCLVWAIGKDECFAMYCTERELDLDLEVTAIAVKVKSVSALGDDFILWFNERIWGQCGETALRNIHTAGGVTPES